VAGTIKQKRTANMKIFEALQRKFKKYKNISYTGT
jgi:hypothetical protein